MTNIRIGLGRGLIYSLVLGVLSSAGCSDEADGGAGGAGGGAPTIPEFEDPAMCAAADAACPPERPQLGAPCEAGLQCEYSEPNWSYACEGGTWSGIEDCGMLVGGPCNVPLEAESCSSPTTSGLSGEFLIGPAASGEFREFEPGELAMTEVGLQGSGMLFYRLKLNSEIWPTCTEAEVSLSVDGQVDPKSTTRATRFRCGETASMYQVLPSVMGCEDFMDGELVDATLTVSISGLGSKEVELQIDSASLCGSIGGF